MVQPLVLNDPNVKTQPLALILKIFTQFSQQYHQIIIQVAASWEVCSWFSLVRTGPEMFDAPEEVPAAGRTSLFTELREGVEIKHGFLMSKVSRF